MSVPYTAENSISEKELIFGKVFALISYASFILNGAFLRSEIFVLSAAISGLGALVAILPRWKEFPYYIKSMLSLILASGFLVSAKAFLYPVAFTFLALAPSAVAIAIYIYKYPALFKVRLVIYCLLLYFFIHFLAGGSPETVFAGSRNQISTILIAFGALALAMEVRRIDMILVLLIFVASVLAVGSTGVIASSLLVLAVVFRQNQSILVKSLAMLALAASFIAFEIYVSYYAPPEFSAKFSLDRLTETDVRFQIISDYLTRYMQGASLWVGPPDQDFAFYVYSYIAFGGTWGYVDNVHNSYLATHAKIGVLAVWAFILLASVGWSLRRHAYILILYLAILARAFGDTVFILDGYYNYCLFYFFILAANARLDGSLTGDNKPGHTSGIPPPRLHWGASYPSASTNSRGWRT